MKNTYSDELGELYGDYARRLGFLYTGLESILNDPRARWWDDTGTLVKERRADIVQRSLRDAVHDAKQRLGPDPHEWRWGTLHRAVFAHPLGRFWPLDWLLNRSVPYGGDGHTVNNAYYRVDQPFDAVVGSSFRMVVDLSDMAHASAMNTTGQSGRPLTPHYDDMIQPWADVEYQPSNVDGGGRHSSSCGGDIGVNSRGLKGNAMKQDGSAAGKLTPLL